MTFSAGSVLGRAFSVVFKNFVPFFVIGLVIVVPFTVLQHLVDPDAGKVVIATSPAERAAASAFPPGRIASMLLGWIANSVLAGALAYATFLGLKNQKVSVGECLSRGFVRFLPIIGVSVVATVGIAAGLFLLIVPGIMLACMWYVAVAATTVERTGIIASLKRSSELTRGHRWTIFRLFLLVFAMTFLVGMVFAGIFLALGAIAGLILLTVLGIVIGLVGGALQAVAYHDLRVVKEGTSTDELLKVFA